MHWLNQPSTWSHTGDRIIVTTDAKTDFWRITHYGFIRDNGHFYFDSISTDFTVDVTIRGQYKDLYDQAGLMVRLDHEHWLKTGIEYVDGVQNLSAVVTHGYSDWSIMPLSPAPDALYLRLERRQSAIQISYGIPEGGDRPTELTLFRMTYMPTPEANPALQVGVMCASPDGNGYEVTFEGYRVTPCN